MKMSILAALAVYSAQVLLCSALTTHKKIGSVSEILNELKIHDLHAVASAGPAEPIYVVAHPAVTSAPSAAADDEDDDDEDEHQDDGTACEPCCEQDDTLRKLEKMLSNNLRKQKELQESVEDLNNDTQTHQEIDSVAKVVANETESPAMGRMLSNMWKDMRMFEYPEFLDHLQEEISELQQKQEILQANISTAKELLKDCTASGNVAAQGTHEENSGASKEEFALPSELKKSMGYTSWWTLPAEQKTLVFEYSVIYLLGGILAALLYRAALLNHPLSLLPEVAAEKVPSTTDFSFSLFGCFGAPKFAALGCCCPCLVWSTTLDRKTGLPTFWKAFALFFGLMWLATYTAGVSAFCLVLLGVFYRQKLRSAYQINNGGLTLAIDFLAWFFCTPCAIIQEAREEGVLRTESIEQGDWEGEP